MAAMKLVCLDCAQVNRVPSDRISAAKCGTCGAKLLPGKAVEIDLPTLQKAARTDDLPLVVDFWAPWCGPCRQMAPAYAQAATALKTEARLVKLNTEAHAAAGARYGIRGIPTLIKFAGGREIKRQAGAVPGPAIISWIKS